MASLNNLARLSNEFGQSPWLDNLKRGYLTSGQLAKVRDSGIRGLTSNPTIFQKAIQGSTEYDSQFAALTKSSHSALAAYWEMVLRDIHGALEVFAPVYEASNAQDGFVSVEVDPGLAHDAQATEAAARDLHRRVNRPNVMIKIPATVAGIPAIKAMISEGRNVNVTLIFSLDRYQQVINAYIEGLEILATKKTGTLAPVASVASFFISRVDTEIDRRLDAQGSPAALELRGSAAISQAKLAYELFQKAFSGPRWHALSHRGAAVQRPLWASTSTKNVAYPDTLYVDQLIGPFTVNTLPDPTVEAFLDHGTLARTIDVDLDKARQNWADLATVGVDVASVATLLEREGVSSFQRSFDELIATLALKASVL